MNLPALWRRIGRTWAPRWLCLTAALDRTDRLYNYSAVRSELGASGAIRSIRAARVHQPSWQCSDRCAACRRPQGRRHRFHWPIGHEAMIEKVRRTELISPVLVALTCDFRDAAGDRFAAARETSVIRVSASGRV